MTRIGIEIGGTKQQIVVGDAEGRIIDRCRFTVDPAGGGPVIRDRMAEELPPILAEHHPERIGVGFGGPVDITAGTVAVSHQIEGWSGFPLRDWLHELTELPVVIENDANTAALGEALRGAGRGFNPAFYMNMGSGVGGGLVIEGKIYHGDKPGEVEVGHLRLDPDGTTVEDRCSGWAVDRTIRAAFGNHPDSLLAPCAATLPAAKLSTSLKPLLRGIPLRRTSSQPSLETSLSPYRTSRTCSIRR